jgi:hypothetical protein
MGNEMVERRCLLFEAGDYPDKGVTVTEADLQTIARNSMAEIPVRIEHLASSPLDGLLGVVTGLQARGRELWGVLRQSADVWQLLKRAGAQALSVGLDVTNKRIVETSLVCRPRVAKAQVFGQEAVVSFCVTGVYQEEDKGMTGVRQLAEGLIGYLKGAAQDEPMEFAEERARLQEEKERLAQERIGQQIGQWKREGKLRATDTAEQLARTLLGLEAGAVVPFGNDSVPVSALFARFVSENGAVVPMGERLPTEGLRAFGGSTSGSAQAKLIALTEEKIKQEGMSYFRAFAAVAAENPELAEQARE